MSFTQKQPLCSSPSYKLWSLCFLRNLHMSIWEIKWCLCVWLLLYPMEIIISMSRSYDQKSVLFFKSTYLKTAYKSAQLDVIRKFNILTPNPLLSLFSALQITLHQITISTTGNCHIERQGEREIYHCNGLVTFTTNI